MLNYILTSIQKCFVTHCLNSHIFPQRNDPEVSLSRYFSVSDTFRNFNFIPKANFVWPVVYSTMVIYFHMQGEQSWSQWL